VQSFLKARVYPRQRKLGALAGVWTELLPETLLEHTCLEGLARGRLRVLVDDAASLYELGLLKQELLDRLRELAPNAAPSEIKFVRGQWYSTNEEGVRIAQYPEHRQQGGRNRRRK
jgi:hypothetical protein